MDNPRIAGVVLAGGQSSRMGQDKAELQFHGKNLVDHMIEILKDSGISDIYLSGERKGYCCIPDSTPHAGPARAVAGVMGFLKDYDGVLFVPVDMPFLTAGLLRTLLNQACGGYFERNFLPVFIRNPFCATELSSMRALLESAGIRALPLEKDLEGFMENINTPDAWQKALRL